MALLRQFIDQLVANSCPENVYTDFRTLSPFSATPLRQLQRTILRPPVCVFKAWRNLSVRCGQDSTKPWGGTVPPPVGRPRAQVKERVGRTTPFSSSAMSSDRLFLDRVARQHCPSPLHRHEQNNMHSSSAWDKGDISLLKIRAVTIAGERVPQIPTTLLVEGKPGVPTFRDASLNAA